MEIVQCERCHDAAELDKSYPVNNSWSGYFKLPNKWKMVKGLALCPNCLKELNAVVKKFIICGK